jgi:hypothetical protein
VKGDLERLIAAVEAGGVQADFTGEMCGGTLWPCIPDGVFHPDQIMCLLKAYNGSLDAALRLHDALLPGWVWDVSDCSEAEVWPPDDPPGNWPIRGVAQDQPARAWLLAILRALAGEKT